MDAVNRIGDLLDDGQPNQSFEACENTISHPAVIRGMMKQEWGR